jgi:hypothetical protein
LRALTSLHSNDSVDCAVCQCTYHMNCVKPPLAKKPSRGFAWSCAQCSRAQERKLEARNTPTVRDANLDADEEEELFEEEEDDGAAIDTGRTSPANGPDESHPPATAEQIYHASLWPYRYLGIHCKVEDALDYDDRIYPRAATRVGPRHQANVLPWPGRPVEYVKPLEVKKSNRRDARSKEVLAALEKNRAAREKRPKWVQDEPPGYVARGEDLPADDPNSTATLLYKPPEEGDSLDAQIDDYMTKASKMGKSLGLPDRSTNLLDVSSMLLYENKFDFATSLKELPSLDSSLFKEPNLTAAEQKKFEEAVSKYGSELHNVTKHTKLFYGDVVRYYYVWKKSDRGKLIWGNYTGRKGKKEAKEAKKAEAAAASKLQDDVAHDHDDSAFDHEKAAEKKRQFTCKFCNTKSSRQWRRAPNATSSVVAENGVKANSKEKGIQYIVALCRRCAELWRRYAVQWEDMEALAQKVANAGGRAWKKKIDEELLKELAAGDDMMRQTVYTAPDLAQQASLEPPRKKLKGAPDSEPNASDSGMSGIVIPKKRERAEKPPPPPAPEIPKPKTMPCAICQQLEPLGDQHLSCRECRLAVHRSCYGVLDNRNPGKWVCDMCLNDKNPQLSIHYKCVLCPVETREHDFVEPPRISHKKKTEKERERERVEREAAQKVADYYRKRQEEMHRPVNPREPLKRTADNNWVHVTCATWTPEVKFGAAKALGPSEGIPSIPRARYAEVCKCCKKTDGACVACHHCRAPVHVECAHQNGYLLGFDITPVKGSRRDQFNIVTINGESGVMSAAVWCKDHFPQKTIVHRMYDTVDDTGMTVLQLYVQNFKQADLALTGCARKANLITLAARMVSTTTPAQPVNRRASLTLPPLAPSSQPNGDHHEHSLELMHPGGKVCLTCGTNTSLRWYPIDEEQGREAMNGYYGHLGAEAQKFMAQRKYQCHPCKKRGRQPKPHIPIKLEAEDREVAPPPPPTRGPSPPPVAAEPPPSHARNPYAWNTPPVASASQHAPSISTSGPQSAQAAGALAPAPGGLGSIPSGGGPVGDRRPLTGPSHAYPPPPSRPYDDWPRAAPHRSPPVHHPPPPHGAGHAQAVHPVAMAPAAIPPLAPPNHLRPPPIGTMSHAPQGPPPPMPNGHMGQSMVNGLPPSPRRTSGPSPPMTNGSPYMHSYHSVHHAPPPPPPPPPSQHMSNGVAPSRGPEHPFSQVLHPQRSPFSSSINSPPVSRDGMPMGRDDSHGQRRPSEPRANASVNASLRNLLS